MRKLFILPFIFTCLCSKAQDPVVKYYDADGSESTKEKATYYAEFLQGDNSYKCNTFWIRSGALRSRTAYSDSTMKKATGLQVVYFKNGNVEDSGFYDNDGNLKSAWHFYENKQLAMHYENNNGAVTEGFDETGKKIKNYIFEKEAEFKGGDKAWHSYILKHVSKDFPMIKTDVELTVHVEIQFIVDGDGYVTRPKVVKSSGYRYVDMDALNVIASSPQWKNAVQYNKPVKAYRLQPFTYVLPPSKK